MSKFSVRLVCGNFPYMQEGEILHSSGMVLLYDHLALVDRGVPYMGRENERILSDVISALHDPKLFSAISEQYNCHI